jgi:hypothetical protein
VAIGPCLKIDSLFALLTAYEKIPGSCRSPFRPVPSGKLMEQPVSMKK